MATIITTRQRGFSFSNLVKRTTTKKKPYSASSNDQKKQLTPAQISNTVAAAEHKKVDVPPFYIIISTYLNYLLLVVFGHLRDMLGKLLKREEYAHIRMNDVRI
jgi:serine palmitoyltransferase